MDPIVVEVIGRVRLRLGAQIVGYAFVGSLLGAIAGIDLVRWAS